MSKTTLRVKLIKESEKAFLVELLDYGREEWWPKKHATYNKKMNKEELEVATWSLESKQKDWAEKEALAAHVNQEIPYSEPIIQTEQEVQQEQNDVVDLAALLVEAKRTNELLVALLKIQT